MKTKTTVVFATLLCAAVTVGYWIGYEHGKNQVPRLNPISNLKQVGLSFRSDRNNIRRFTATGAVTATKVPVERR
jgi:type III secretory pathway component EscU